MTLSLGPKCESQLTQWLLLREETLRVSDTTFTSYMRVVDNHKLGTHGCPSPAHNLPQHPGHTFLPLWQSYRPQCEGGLTTTAFQRMQLQGPIFRQEWSVPQKHHFNIEINKILDTPSMQGLLLTPLLIGLVTLLRWSQVLSELLVPPSLTYN